MLLIFLFLAEGAHFILTFKMRELIIVIPLWVPRHLVVNVFYK